MSDASLLPWLLSVALLMVRLIVALALSPALSSHGVPATVRVALMLALSLLIFAQRGAPPAASDWALNPLSLVVPVLAEVLIGAFLGLTVHVALAAFAVAGRLLDVQIGFAIGSIFDPVTRTSSNVLGSLVSLLGVTLFMVSGAPLQLAGLMSASLDALPLGQMPLLSDPMRPLLAAGSMFVIALAIAAPVAFALLLTDVAVGVASRNMPQVNVLALAIPVKAVVGYLVLAFAVTGWGPLLQRGFGRVADALGAG